MNNNLTEIIQACIRKDRKSQNELYRQFYSYGMSIAIRYIHDENEAVEIVNDSFMKAFKNLSKYDQKVNFKPWFRKIVVNTSIDQIKKIKRLQMKTDINEAEQISVKEEILSRIGYKELMDIVQTLSLAYRTVFNMYVIDGYKHNEIAEKLGISVGTSKSNLSKARVVLQKKIGDQLNTDYA